MFSLWNAQLSDLGQSITQYQNTIYSKNQRLIRMDEEIIKLEGIIRDTKSSKDHATLRTIVKQNVNAILNDKRALLLLALLESLRKTLLVLICYFLVTICQSIITREITFN